MSASETINEINDAINRQIAAYYNVKIVPIQYPSQGNFFWYYENDNQFFNQATFNYISARVSQSDIPGVAKLSTAGSFPNAFSDVLSSIDYALNQQDEQKLDSALRAADQQGKKVVRIYEKEIGKISNTSLLTARNQLGASAVRTDLDYVITFRLGYVWSGLRKKHLPPLSYQEMQDSPSLSALLPDLPASASRVVVEVSKYLDQMKSATQIQDEVNLGSWILKQLKTNSTTPNQLNGGMKTVNPNNGQLSNYQVGYGIPTSIAAIQQALNSNRSLSVTINVSESDSNSAKVQIENGPELSVPSVLSFSLPNSFDYQIDKIEGAGKQETMTIEYDGFVMIPINPSAWQQTTKMGWFDIDPVREAVQNVDQRNSGFYFQTKPSFNFASFADGGDFNWLSGLLVSNLPKVTIEYKGGNYEQFVKNWSTKKRGNLRLLGETNIGDSTSGVYTSDILEGESAEEFSLTFAPVQTNSNSNSPSIPLLQQTAYVIGGVVASATNTATRAKSISVVQKLQAKLTALT